MDAFKPILGLLGQVFLIVLVCAVGTTGCAVRKARRWTEPTFAVPARLSASGEIADPCADPSLIDRIEEAYAAAQQFEQESSSACVDRYFDATVLSWSAVERIIQTGQRDDIARRKWELYHSSLAKLISTGQDFGRLDARRGLIVKSQKGSMAVGVSYSGFPWQPRDFARLSLVGNYATKKLTRAYRRTGLGVRLVATTRTANSRFMRPDQPFAATAILRYTPDGSGNPVLEFHDPLRTEAVVVGSRTIPVSADISAPLAIRLVQRDQNPLRGFIQPGTTDAPSGVFMIEPYQPGKIPLIAVHGLLSDPQTWADLGNELRARPEITERYQLWIFQYPTGQPFLKSGADLRHQIAGLRAHFDPHRTDKALDHMILIGHSMGGLVSKLQTTYSGSHLWKTIANRPIENIVADDQSRHDLAKLFFFQPVSEVKRVVFIGTPHRGSSWARRIVGRIGAKLVNETPDRVERHQRLVDNNPGVFSDEVLRRIPTSIDFLEPCSPLLLAIDRLPKRRLVKYHSIVGTGRWMIRSGPSDGIVPVSSARHREATSEKIVRARHEDLHRHPETIQEVLRILSEHWRSYRQTMVANRTPKSSRIHKWQNSRRRY